MNLVELIAIFGVIMLLSELPLILLLLAVALFCFGQIAGGALVLVAAALTAQGRGRVMAFARRSGFHRGRWI